MALMMTSDGARVSRDCQCREDSSCGQRSENPDPEDVPPESYIVHSNFSIRLGGVPGYRHAIRWREKQTLDNGGTSAQNTTFRACRIRKKNTPCDSNLATQPPPTYRIESCTHETPCQNPTIFVQAMILDCEPILSCQRHSGVRAVSVGCGTRTCDPQNYISRRRTLQYQ